MRFSNILYQVNYHRHFQRIWKKQGRLQASELKIPQELRDMGVIIKDAKEILLENKRFPKTTSITVKPEPPSIFNLPHYYFVMNDKVQISESENQILSLTKSIPYKTLPKQISSLIGACCLPNQNEAVQNSVLQAYEWDGDQYKLPKIVDPENPRYIFKRVFGTLHSKKVSNLLEKLAYLCDCAIGKYAGCLGRDRVINAFGDLAITRDDQDVTFQMPCDILLTSNKPLARFSDPGEVSATSQFEVPNIYPIRSTLDLQKFEEQPYCKPVAPISLKRHLHTLLLAHMSTDVWQTKELLSRMIGTCFAFSARQALMAYGAAVRDLPEPICVQCALLDGQTLHLMAYQLNTLAMETDDGIKNQVWMEEGGIHTTEAFPKLMALHVNGLA